MASEMYAHLKTDLRRLIRDQFLVGMTIYILVIAVVIRSLLPVVSTRLGPEVDLPHYYPLINSYLSVVTGGILVGAIGGLLLLETREDRTLDAVRVSPMPVGRMLMYEAAFVFSAAAPVIWAMATIIGAGVPDLGMMLAISVAGAASAPVFSMAISNLARDKVEAFALMKIVGIVATATLAAWFVPEPWQWFAIVLPPYAAVKAWWLAVSDEPGAWRWLGLAFAVNGVFLFALVGRWIKSR